jgi:hypothetical protein
MPTNNVHHLYLLRDLITNFVVTQQSNCVPVGRQTEILIALMMEAVSISETSVTLYQSTRRNIPDDSHLNAHALSEIKHRPDTTRVTLRQNVGQWQYGICVFIHRAHIET